MSQVMAWHQNITSHYLNQWWQNSVKSYDHQAAMGIDALFLSSNLLDDSKCLNFCSWGWTAIFISHPPIPVPCFGMGSAPKKVSVTVSLHHYMYVLWLSQCIMDQHLFPSTVHINNGMLILDYPNLEWLHHCVNQQECWPCDKPKQFHPVVGLIAMGNKKLHGATRFLVTGWGCLNNQISL